MAYIFYNPNPCHRSTSDCVIRAIAKVLDISWEDSYKNLCNEGLIQCDLPNANHVWERFLKNVGFRKQTIPDDFPYCYSLRDFCVDHPYGDYVACTGEHAVCIIDGDFYDSWNSESVIITYFFEREV